MTIKTVVSNMEKPEDEQGRKNFSYLRVTVTEVGLLNGEVKTTKNVVEISAGRTQEFHVYAGRSLLIEATNRP